MNVNNDKLTEKNRYDKIASDRFAKTQSDFSKYNFGSKDVKETLRKPYIHYEKLLDKHISSNDACLELGSGEGRFTRLLLETGCKVYALDISKISNEFNKKVNSSFSNLETIEGDIEDIPFDDNSMDVVVSAGSLSYGSKTNIKKEILRVLKPGGRFICIDSLNDSFIYRLNRYLRYLFKDRSLMTLMNMWNTSDINDFKSNFLESKVYFYGSISWLEPVLARFLGKGKFISLSDYFDKFKWLKSCAFKFVFVGFLDKEAEK